ncbi:MAG TPA: hypothetical protein VLK33_01150 [Terriglobales bacterium]|nr:hypothetical protein [Terriglobales bacterium]
MPVLFLFFVGCTNLDDVAELKKLADGAQQTLPPIVADIPSSCQRQDHLISDIPENEKPPGIGMADCKPYQDVADNIIKDQNVLIAYFDALGKLASNAPLSYSANLSANAKSVGAMPNLSSHAAAAHTAAQSIGKILADAVTKSYRQKKVDSLIEQADGDVQELTGDLKKIIVEDYAGILSNESLALDTYYKSPIEAAVAARSERLALIVVQRQRDGDLALLESRKSTILVYGQIMDKLAVLHAKLKQEAEKKASLREIGEQVGPLVSDLKDAISKLQAGLK